MPEAPDTVLNKRQLLLLLLLLFILNLEENTQDVNGLSKCLFSSLSLFSLKSSLNYSFFYIREGTWHFTAFFPTLNKCKVISPLLLILLTGRLNR